MPSNLLTAQEVADKLSVTRPHLYNLMRDETLPLPRPMRLSPATIRWRAEAIEEYLDKQQARANEGEASAVDLPPDDDNGGSDPVFTPRA